VSVDGAAEQGLREIRPGIDLARESTTGRRDAYDDLGSQASAIEWFMAISVRFVAVWAFWDSLRRSSNEQSFEA
jgi:hypothetical protein